MRVCEREGGGKRGKEREGKRDSGRGGGRAERQGRDAVIATVHCGPARVAQLSGRGTRAKKVRGRVPKAHQKFARACPRRIHVVCNVGRAQSRKILCNLRTTFIVII